MALVVKDRVQETTTTTGTGTLTLAGAVSGFQSFSVIGNGNTTYYSITGGAEWEIGIGTYTASGTTLSRDTVLESSNSGSLVNFSAGSKTVFCTYPAERSMYVDGTTITPATTATLPITSGGTGSSTATFSGENITSLNASAISSGTLGVARGGTGAATLDANNVILGNGTSAVQFVAPGTASNVLTSNGTTWVSQAAGGGGGSWTPVLSGSFTGSPTNITSFPTGEGIYLLAVLCGFTSNGSDQVWSIRVSFDGGSTFISTAGSYWDSSAGATGNAFPWLRSFPTAGSATVRGVWYLYINQHSLGGVPMTTINPASVNIASANTAGSVAYSNGGYRLGTSPCSGIQIIRTVGTLNPIAGSKYVVYKMGAWS